MAVSAPTVVATIDDDGNATSYTSTSFTVTSGRLYFCAFLLNEGGAAAEVGSVAGSSALGSFARLTDDGFAYNGAWGAGAWWILASAGGAGETVTWSASSATHEGITGWVLEVASGFDPADPIGDIDEFRATSTSIAADSFAPSSTSLAIAVIGHANANLHTVSGDYSELVDLDGGSPNRAACIVYDDSAPGTTPGASWTTSATARLVAWEVNAALNITMQVGMVNIGF